MVCRWIRSLLGLGGPQLFEFTAGGAIAAGDILVWSSGQVVKSGDAPDGETIAGVAMGSAAAAGEPVLVCLPSPTDIYQTTGSGTLPNVGSYLEVDVTSGVTTFVTASATAKRVAQLLKVVDATTKTIQIRFVVP